MENLKMQLKLLKILNYPLEINEDKTNKLEWKKAKKFWKNIVFYANNYNPLGAKPQEVKSIYKLNKIKDNLETAISKREEIKSYSQTLLMFVDFILHLIKVRHDDILRRLCNVAVFKYKREQIMKTNEEIDEERQKIIEEAKANNPNVRIPVKGQEIVKEEEKVNEEEKVEEKKEEEKTEEKKEEEKKEEEKKEEEKKEEGEQNNQSQGVNNEEAKEGEIDEEKKNESDSIKLAEQLKKFDEEHVKQEVPNDIEYDIDNDYDIDQNEKDTIINAALQAASNPQPSFDKKK